LAGLRPRVADQRPTGTPKSSPVPMLPVGSAWRGPVLDDATLQVLNAHMHEGDASAEEAPAAAEVWCLNGPSSGFSACIP
jgi:hypothetical protein